MLMSKFVSTLLDHHFKLSKLQMLQSENEVEHMRTVSKFAFYMLCKGKEGEELAIFEGKRSLQVQNKPVDVMMKLQSCENNPRPPAISQRAKVKLADYPKKEGNETMAPGVNIRQQQRRYLKSRVYSSCLKSTNMYRNRKRFIFLGFGAIWRMDHRFFNISAADPFNRSSFPPHFIFGTGSSAYQFEGAANEDGKGPSTWDTFAHKYPEKIIDGSNGDVAIDFYHLYKEDITLMKLQGLNGFKFSLSWSRVLPYGKLSKGVNKKGIAFYNNLINELLANGIEPLVSIFHWDLPQALEDEYQGFLSTQIVDDFRDYAELCFKEFGDRVKHWITINEPYTYAVFGYAFGSRPPGRCSYSNGCIAGNDATEPYIVAHHLLLAHAKAVKLYRKKYKASLKGKIGISLISNWFVPYYTEKKHIDAAQRALDFMLGWFIDPLTYGDYPANMHKLVKDRLPKFTQEEVEMVKGSYDFLGTNYYTSTYAVNMDDPDPVNLNYATDSQVYLTWKKDNIPIGEPTGSNAIFVVPEGLQQLLIYIKEKYKNPIIYVTENGMSDANVTTIQQGVNDLERTKCIRQHLLAIKDSLQDGVNVKGYFVWSFLDNFEWNSGYTERYGINYVDFNDNLKRYPKRSALWLKKFLLANREIYRSDY
ncbi:Beta-glucosidase 12 [Capsicum chinense]|nr:Beta-glucosidase 12 [Capsicum chinense]